MVWLYWGLIEEWGRISNVIFSGRGHVYYGQHWAEKGLNCSTYVFAVCCSQWLSCLAFLFFLENGVFWVKCQNNHHYLFILLKAYLITMALYPYDLIWRLPTSFIGIEEQWGKHWSICSWFLCCCKWWYVCLGVRRWNVMIRLDSY